MASRFSTWLPVSFTALGIAAAVACPYASLLAVKVISYLLLALVLSVFSFLQFWERFGSIWALRLVGWQWGLRSSGEPVAEENKESKVPLYGIRQRRFTLPAQDGSLLSTAHFEPFQACKVGVTGTRTKILCLPVILIRTPYSVHSCELICNLLCQRGYHVLVQDHRGRFDSEGEISFLGNDKVDAPGTLEWICKQPWCEGGHVALYGMSMDGYAAFAMLAAEQDRLADQYAMQGDANSVSAPRIAAMYILRSSSDIGKRGMFWAGALALETTSRYLDMMLYTHMPGSLLGSTRLHFIWKLMQIFKRHTLPAFRQVEKHLPLGTIEDVVQEFSGLQFGTTSPVWEMHVDPKSEYWHTRDHSTVLTNAFRLGLTPEALHFSTGWYDVFCDAMISDYETVRDAAAAAGLSTPKLTVGPWGHFDGYVKDVRQNLELFDRCLKAGGKTCRSEQRPVQLFMLGCGAEFIHANGNTGQARVETFRERLEIGTSPSSAQSDIHPAWRSFSAWPPAEAKHATLALQLIGALALLPVGADVPLSASGQAVGHGTRLASFTFDPEDPPRPLGGSRFGFDLFGRVRNEDFEARKDVLVFDSPPLAGGNLEIAGRPRLTLLIRCFAVSCDIFARLCDVDPAGRSVIVCDGFTRVGGDMCLKSSTSANVQHRLPVRRASSLHVGSPVRRGSSASILDDASPRKASQQDADGLGPLALTLELNPTAAVFCKDHSIRLCIAGGAFPAVSRNLGMGEPLGSALHMCVQHTDLLEAREVPALSHVKIGLELPVLGGQSALRDAFGIPSSG